MGLSLAANHPYPPDSAVTLTAPTAPLVNSTPARALVLDVGGMKCAGCVGAVERQLADCPGVERVTVNLVTEVAVVAIAPDHPADTLAQTLADRLTAAGFPSQPRQGAGAEPLADWVQRQEMAVQQHRRQWAIALGLLLFSALGHGPLLGLPPIPILGDLWFHGLLATATLVGPGRSILVDGARSLGRGVPTMDTLVGLGALSSYGASVVALGWPELGWDCFFDEPVMLLSFILLGRTLEQRARFQASQALRSLIARQPATARLVAPGAALTTTVEVPAACVQVGEWVQVLPGETIPADGVVEQGQTTVDEALVTGEALPVLKQPGDRVVAGTVNQGGAIALRVTHTGGDTVLAQMVHLVEQAQTRKAPIQRFADVLSGYFTYGVLALAVATFGFWYLWGTAHWPQVVTPSAATAMAGHGHLPSMASGSPLLVSLKLAIAVLVIACPCALGLATPTAILVGSGRGAQQGLLVRGGDVLELLSRVDTVVFDKTGTLTQGQPQVTGWLADGVRDGALQALAAAVEQGTQHPLALAVRQWAAGVEPWGATDFQTLPGRGATARITDPGPSQPAWIGSPAYLEAQGLPCPAKIRDWLAARSAQETLMGVALGDRWLGAIAVRDPLRSEAAALVSALKQRGIQVALLTGDRQAVAQGLAAQVGIPVTAVTATADPATKVEQVKALQQAGHRVAFVGDGLNDAPVLAQADVGISLGSATDIATEAAGVVLMGDRLGDLLAALDLGRATVNKIRQNLLWAFAYNLLGLPIAAGILLPSLGFSLSPALAGALMASSSVTVVLNSLLLGRSR